MKIATFSIFAATVALLFGLISPEAAAQDETWRKDRFMVGFGMYQPNFDTKIRVDESTTGISGTLLNLEKDLDLSDRETQVTLDAHFRFARRHAIEFDWVDLKRKDESTVLFGIDYDGDFIGINEDVTTTFNTEIIRLAYRFSFINNEKMELSGSVGLHVTDLKLGLNVIGEEEEFNDITAPLPTLGVAWKYHFNEQWTFHIGGEWLSLKIDNVKGDLFSGVAEVTWYPFDNFGASLGYDVWDLGVTATKNTLTGKVDYKFDGPKLTLRARF